MITRMKVSVKDYIKVEEISLPVGRKERKHRSREKNRRLI